MDELTAPGAPALADAPEPARLPRLPTARQRFEYYAAYAVLKLLGWLPHRLARGACGILAALSYWLWPRLRRVGLFNLGLAFPEWSGRDRRRVLFGLFQNLGRMLADFAHFPHMNRANIERFLVYDGFENYARAQEEGKGVLFLTAHFGNWEISSFAHGLYGYPCNFIVRELDNPLIGALVERYRSRSGGRPIEKTKFGSQVLRAFKNAEAVGILMDQNMLPGEGSFVDFFGRSACTTTAPARLARRTGVPMVLGLVIWDEKLKKYKLRFDPVEWIRKDSAEEEILANTANFTRLIEEYIRRYPDHWLWVHRRWKTRPPGEPPLY
ncbi:MAG TPA: lysophospholipid acyltransferase family protein [Terriglobia bacterium]|nr:lysophospholipid acyltransferase family protein [Terriglobia bacterium]